MSFDDVPVFIIPGSAQEHLIHQIPEFQSHDTFRSSGIDQTIQRGLLSVFFSPGSCVVLHRLDDVGKHLERTDGMFAGKTL